MSKPSGRHTSKSRLIGVSDNVVEPTLSESNVDDIFRIPRIPPFYARTLKEKAWPAHILSLFNARINYSK